MEDLKILTREILGIQLTATQLNALELYETELLEWNSRINLTAIRDPEQVRVKHFLDSFTCLCVMRDTPMDHIVDVGTGAGFPGIPLKIINPTMKLTLVESVGKKAEFCRYIAKTLNLEGVQVIQKRVETLGNILAFRQKFDWAIARAVAVMPVLAEYLLPLARVGGAVLAMKGEGAPAEVHEADHAIHLLGGHLRKLVPLTLPGVVEERYLVVIDKVAATPNGYPRATGVPAKRPLGVKH